MFVVKVIQLYGSLGYRALSGGVRGGLKKKCSHCRYCGESAEVFQEFYKDVVRMSKRELIDYICEINKSARPEFLANFSEEDLSSYLEHLMDLDLEELSVCA